MLQSVDKTDIFHPKHRLYTKQLADLLSFLVSDLIAWRRVGGFDPPQIFHKEIFAKRRKFSFQPHRLCITIFFSFMNEKTTFHALSCMDAVVARNNIQYTWEDDMKKCRHCFPHLEKGSCQLCVRCLYDRPIRIVKRIQICQQRNTLCEQKTETGCKKSLII
jgi:hypothetical protein